ncbi:hypothetical protein EYF80_023086 [Liparis tanakae]|uniref:Translin-associated factor X-interacting protein 1 N-terminal domain-containing protein n=1 Tax=Liparis tanakae TaxID=230148 RepID=A0A4Z2HLR6_9TELE|nr:hypothetical protein EYF80_023086 [Liparis tanakae]
MSYRGTPESFRSDIHGLLLAAEAGQKADILTYSSGHLGPRSLVQSQPHGETKQSFWRMCRGLEETPNQTRAKALTYVKKKACPFEFSTDTAESDPRAFSQKKANSSSDPVGKQPSDQKGLSNKGQSKSIQQLGRQVRAKQDLWAGTHVSEMHERKLQKGLRRLSAQSWPSRDRLAVFSDVFDDVCEGSPVFGRILREIKTDYDLYANSLMASQSLRHKKSLGTSLRYLGNDKGRQMELKDAIKEVFRLEQEFQSAQEENKRVRDESHNVPAPVGPEDGDMTNTSLSGLRDGGTAHGPAGSVQSKRLQVLITWRENQRLEEELKEKPVSFGEITATELCIKDVKTEMMRLIASNERLKTTNKARQFDLGHSFLHAITI